MSNDNGWDVGSCGGLILTFVLWGPGAFLFVGISGEWTDGQQLFALAVILGLPFLMMLWGDAQQKSRRTDSPQERVSPEEMEARRRRTEILKAAAEDRKRQRLAEEELKAKIKWKRYHEAMDIENTDGMSGRAFETFVATLLQRSGFVDVQTTPASGDQGCDLQCASPDGKKTVIQTKRWKRPVGNNVLKVESAICRNSSHLLKSTSPGTH